MRGSPCVLSERHEVSDCLEVFTGNEVPHDDEHQDSQTEGQAEVLVEHEAQGKAGSEDNGTDRRKPGEPPPVNGDPDETLHEVGI